MNKQKQKILGIVLFLVGAIGLGVAIYGFTKGWWSTTKTTNTNSTDSAGTWGTVYGQENTSSNTNSSSNSDSLTTAASSSSTSSSSTSPSSSTTTTNSASSSSSSSSSSASTAPPSGALGQVCNTDGSCDDGLWCKTSDKRCYQQCTKTKNMCTPSLVPRKNTYECDYDAPMCSADAGKIGQVCGPDNTCQGNAECKNGRCYERCGASGSCTSETMPRKNTYWCNPTAPQCNAGHPTAPSILSSTPALTTGGPPAYPAQMGNNTNYLVYKDYKWDDYTCGYLDKYFPYDIGALDGRIVGRVNQDPQGKLYAMRASCVDSIGNMQGHLVAAPGWKAYQNMSCSTCPGINADAKKAKAVEAYLNAPCHQCPPGWLPDGTECYPVTESAIQTLAAKNMSGSLSVATIQSLFPNLHWTLCPNTDIGVANVCSQCPPGWNLVPGDSDACAPGPSTSAADRQAVLTSLRLGMSASLPSSLSVSDLVHAGITWANSCDHNARPTAAAQKTYQQNTAGALSAGQLQSLASIPLAQWQVAKIQMLWNQERSYLTGTLCPQPNLFYQLIGTPGTPTMQTNGLTTQILGQYQKICQILGVASSSSSSSSSSPPSRPAPNWDQVQSKLSLQSWQTNVLKYFYNNGGLQKACASPGIANSIFSGYDSSQAYAMSAILSQHPISAICQALSL